MNVKHFSIKNYRAIKEIDISLRYSLIPIIGINESGKTSILQAILAFDFRRDKYNKGEHLEYQNKYSTVDTTDSSVSATLNLTQQEIESLIADININTDSEDYNALSKFNNETQFILIRELSNNNEYKYINNDLTEQTTNKVTCFLKNKFPFVLYFDDFTDRVPQSIEFKDTYATDGKLTRGRKREWQEIIEEVFKRSNQENLNETQKPLQTYMSVDNEDRKTDILSDIQSILNDVIISEWKNLKNTGGNLADDSTNLELILENKSNSVFKFKVKDKSNSNKSRTFSINSRSKGFQWFFNYMVKLKFNPNYSGDTLENALFLLDEPGSYLHSSAQIELLKELKKVSNNNQVIFCTHSQFLLDPKTIELGSIRIAEKTGSEVKSFNFGDCKAKRDKGALTPIYQALNLNFAHDFMDDIVILEGITDFYLFELLKKYKHISQHIKFIPGAGAENSSSLISIAIAFAENFLVLLDNDIDGKKAKIRYTEYFGDSIKNNIHFYNTKNSFKLESFLNAENKRQLKLISNCKDVKKSLSFLYYSKKNKEQKKFIQSIAKNDSLVLIIKVINQISK